jgi:hypothetical protein
MSLTRGVVEIARMDFRNEGLEPGPRFRRPMLYQLSDTPKSAALAKWLATPAGARVERTLSLTLSP